MKFDSSNPTTPSRLTFVQGVGGTFHRAWGMSSPFLPRPPIFAVTGIVGAGTGEAVAADHNKRFRQGRLDVAVFSRRHYAQRSCLM